MVGMGARPGMGVPGAREGFPGPGQEREYGPQLPDDGTDRTGNQEGDNKPQADPDVINALQEDRPGESLQMLADDVGQDGQDGEQISTGDDMSPEDEDSDPRETLEELKQGKQTPLIKITDEAINENPAKAFDSIMINFRTELQNRGLGKDQIDNIIRECGGDLNQIIADNTTIQEKVGKFMKTGAMSGMPKIIGKALVQFAIAGGFGYFVGGNPIFILLGAIPAGRDFQKELTATEREQKINDIYRNQDMLQAALTENNDALGPFIERLLADLENCGDDISAKIGSISGANQNLGESLFKRNKELLRLIKTHTKINIDNRLLAAYGED